MQLKLTHLEYDGWSQWGGTWAHLIKKEVNHRSKVIYYYSYRVLSGQTRFLQHKSCILSGVMLLILTLKCTAAQFAWHTAVLCLQILQTYITDTHSEMLVLATCRVWLVAKASPWCKAVCLIYAGSEAEIIFLRWEKSMLRSHASFPDARKCDQTIPN